MTVDALRSACPEARDTAWPGERGKPDSALVALPGGQRVVAVAAGGRVVRIIVDQPGVKTANGLGVGTAVADLRSTYGRMCAAESGRQVAVWFPNAPGLS